MDGGVGVEKQSADHARIIFIDRIAWVGGSVRLLRHEGRVERQSPPLRACLRQQTGIEHPQPGRIRQQIPVLAESGGVLRIDGQSLVVERAWNSVRPWIEDGDGRERLGWHAGIDGGDTILVVAAEQVNARDASRRDRKLRADVEFIRVRPAERRRD